jgi:hypothetical protein
MLQAQQQRMGHDEKTYITQDDDERGMKKHIIPTSARIGWRKLTSS